MWVKPISLSNFHTIFSIANSARDNEILLYKRELFYKHSNVVSANSTNK